MLVNFSAEQLALLNPSAQQTFYRASSNRLRRIRSNSLISFILEKKDGCDGGGGGGVGWCP